MEDDDGGWWWRTAERFSSTLVCKQGRPLTVVVDLQWPEHANLAPMLCTKTTTRSSCLLLPPQGMACSWLTLPRCSGVSKSSKFYLLLSIPKVTVAARPIEWPRKVEGWTLENHFKQVKLKLKPSSTWSTQKTGFLPEEDWNDISIWWQTFHSAPIYWVPAILQCHKAHLIHVVHHRQICRQLELLCQCI